MAAAFFAGEPLREPLKGAKLVVWALHKRHAKDVATEGVSFPNAPNGAPRIDPTIAIVRPSIAARVGLFTTVSRSGIYFMKSDGKRPSIETFVAEANPPIQVLRKLFLPHEHASDLIDILAVKGCRDPH